MTARALNIILKNRSEPVFYFFWLLVLNLSRGLVSWITVRDKWDTME
ncbi:hypothetical protein EDD68_1356 [Melghiribacillus thermohalophilus]|uniref:Uncharacterized protein n=1 Tax=Melghiribacillus thermohalophilus TaxID=1324956 RepID=A0A4R3MN98_9BACI|nr:hypothetical protein EDD68_1356 [Melghiribacillus thermohalophilus]